MKPATVNLDGDRQIYQGDDYELTLFINQADGVTPLNLTGYTALKAQVRVSATTPQVMAEFACALGNQTTAPGSVIISLTASQTTGMSATASAAWDFEMVNTSSKKGTWFAGSVTIVAEVTRA